MFKIGFLLVFVEVPVEGVEYECNGNKTRLFDNDIKGDGSPLCLRRSMFEVSWRQWSGRPSFLLLRSGDDYQLLSVQISWNNCQRDVNNHLPFFTCWRLTSSDTEIPDVLQEFTLYFWFWMQFWKLSKFCKLISRRRTDTFTLCCMTVSVYCRVFC